MKIRYGIEHFYIELDVFNDERCIMGSAVCGDCGSQNVNPGSGEEGVYMDIKASPSKKD